MNQIGNIGLSLIRESGPDAKIEDKESLDRLFKNLIIIINHFFEYGFIKT